jgi:hypothetical protein
MSDEPLISRQNYSYKTRDDIRAGGWSDVTRRASFRRCSVADLLAWCDENEMQPADVEVSGGSMSFRGPETADERDKRLAQMAAGDARQEKWERETYDRLRAKFADGGTPQ